jgi:hypothetical protein
VIVLLKDRAGIKPRTNDNTHEINDNTFPPPFSIIAATELKLVPLLALAFYWRNRGKGVCHGLLEWSWMLSPLIPCWHVAAMFFLDDPLPHLQSFSLSCCTVVSSLHCVGADRGRYLPDPLRDLCQAFLPTELLPGMLDHACRTKVVKRRHVAPCEMERAQVKESAWSSRMNRTQESGRKGMKLHGEQSIGKRSRSPKLESEKPVLAGKLF